MLFPISHPLALQRLADSRNAAGEVNPLAAAIAIATHHNPTIKPREIDSVINRFVQDVKHMTSRGNPSERVLRHVLFERFNFTGNHERYSDPLNSYIDHVLARHTGLPILLSLIYVETAHRAGAAAWGIGLPGHFIAALDVMTDVPARLYIDPFHKGVQLSVEQCQKTAAAAGVTWNDAYLQPVTGHAWATRMLANLRNTYREMADPANLAAVLEQSALLSPEDETIAIELQSIYNDLHRRAAGNN